ncbi:MAG: DMT family transporter [Clostridiales bacterium]
MNFKKFKGEAALLTTALIWGSGFIAVDMALSCGFKPGLLNMLRFLMGALVLLIALNKNVIKLTKSEVKVGITAGVFYFFGFYLQTVGLQFTTVSNNAILTATNLLMVPFISWLIFKKKPNIRVFIAVFICFIGIAILTWTNAGLNFNIGDTLTLGCALAYACHIAYLGVNAKGKHPLRLSFLQLATVAVLSTFTFFVFEGGDFSGVQWGSGMLVMTYLAIFPTALCLFLQTFGQKYTPTSTSAILLSFESFFGAAFSVLLGFEAFTMNLLMGGSLIIATVIWLEWQNSKDPMAVT